MDAAGLPLNANIMAIRVFKSDPNVIVAISAESRWTGGSPTDCGGTYPTKAPNRAYISTDGGAAFSPISIPATDPEFQQTDNISEGSWAYIEDVKFDKKDPRKLWATITPTPVPDVSTWEMDGELWMS